MEDDNQNNEQARELPDHIADAWAAVLIDIHEKRQGKNAAEHEEKKPCHDNSSASPT